MRKRWVLVAVLLTLTVLIAGYIFAAASKVVICHHNQDDPLEPEWVTIEVAESAVPAHLAHGDILGPCAQ